MSGNAAALAMSQSIPLQRAQGGLAWHERLRDRLTELDLVPDLGSNIGSAEWWRGLATLTLLCGSAIATFPGVRPLVAGGAPALDTADFDEARAQMIMTLALGADRSEEHTSELQSLMRISYAVFCLVKKQAP